MTTPTHGEMPRDTIAEVERRLATFHSPSFDREIVEELLALARRSALVPPEQTEGAACPFCHGALAAISYCRSCETEVAVARPSPADVAELKPTHLKD